MTTGKITIKSRACGKKTPLSGPAPTKTNGWVGWASPKSNSPTSQRCKSFAADVKKAKLKHVLLLGMGGSSLCPEVLRMTFGKIAGFPELHVLDSTDPAQIKAIEKKLDLKKTLCIVSSKSGSTLEPNIFKQYFFERVKKAVGEKRSAAASSPSPIPAPRCSKSPSRQIPENFSRRAKYRRPLLRAFQFRHGPRRSMGIDVGKFLKNTAGNGAGLRRSDRRPTQIPA